MYPEIERRTDLSHDEFYSDYVGKKAVILDGKIKNWPAIGKWNENYFLNSANDLLVNVKTGDTSDKKNVKIPLTDYIKYLTDSSKRKLYLHDIPLPTLLPNLKDDMAPAPLDILPTWYKYKWWRNLFFFYAKKGGITPLHFDNLGTHNLFFHIRGRKRFVIVHHDDTKYCYLHKYSFSQVDPTAPDFEKFPLFKNARCKESILNPGDVLYMPPYTMHHVTSLDTCISVNMDWHTKKSLLKWCRRLYKGAPLSRIKYNTIYITGVLLGIPAKLLYPLYKHYMLNG